MKKKKAKYYYMKNKFSNIISRTSYDNLSQEDKESFLLKHSIYLKLKETPPKKALEIFRKENSLFLSTHELNKELCYEIINRFKYNQELYCDSSLLINKLKFKIDNALNIDHRKEIITSEYHKIYKILLDMDLYYWYSMDDKDYEGFWEDSFEDHVMYEIPDEFVIDYITQDYVNYSGCKVFNDWIQMQNLMLQLNYLKEKDKTKLNKRSEISLIERIILADLMVGLNKDLWEDLSNTKKSELLSLLLDRNDHNIRKELKKLNGSGIDILKKYKSISDLLDQYFPKQR